jgi:molybdate transport system ATP-binding protein
MLQVHIRKQLKGFLLRVDLTCENDTLALLGASGCGKSMTLKCIAGIERPDEGRIVLNDRVLFDSEKGIDLPPQKRRVGYLFQSYALFPNMTVEENIRAALRHLPRERRSAAAAERIRQFHLSGLEGQYPARLSGGEQQRTALARILASEPEVLLLDEPFAALDSYLKWQLELELLELLSTFPGDVVFVSHDRSEVCRLCTTVCVLTDGRSAPKEPVQQLMRAPGTVSAAVLSGCKNYSRASRLSDHGIECSDWGVRLRTAEPVPEELSFAGVRAHHIAPYDGADLENVIPCRVVRVIEDAFSTVVMLATPGGDTGRSLLRMELPREEWAGRVDTNELRVRVAPEHVLPLTGGGIE